MGNDILQLHQAQITRNHIRRLTNLIKLGRFGEAASANIKFTGILTLWEIQQTNMRNAAAKDGSEGQRNTITTLID